jgi:PAS domain S-box-containing protein
MQSQLMALTSNVPAFICRLDAEGRIRFINRLAPGFRMEEVLGLDFLEGLQPEVRGLARAALEQVLAGKESGSYEGYGWGPNGETRFYRSTLGPIREDGQITGAALCSIDCTEQRQTEQALEESENRFRSLYEHIPDALFWIQVDPDGTLRVDGMNPVAERFAGKSTAEARGLTLPEVFPPAVAAQMEANDRHCIATRKAISYEEVLPGPMGPMVLQTTLVPVFDAAGRITRIIGSSRDMTQARKEEEARRQAQRLESLGLLAGGIAHDFNNLLTIILGNLELARLKVHHPSAVEAHLEITESTAMKAGGLVRQLLAYSGQGHMLKAPTSLNRVAKDMLQLMAVSISKKVQLHIELARTLPPVHADEAQLQQVLLNLVTNASESIGEGEGRIRIATLPVTLQEADLDRDFPAQALAPGDYVQLEVEDSGCGMGPEVLRRIFDPFYTTKEPGRGLGLAALTGILKGHLAGVWIRSEEGQGTLFRLVFPVATEALPDQPPATVETPLRLTGRVLLVEDEPGLRAATLEVLDHLGLQVIEAREGKEAVDRFGQGSDLDLVLMDLTMPVMGGQEAFEIMHGENPSVPVILCSGYDTRDLEQRPGLHPAAFLQKPYTAAALRRMLTGFLRPADPD